MYLRKKTDTVLLDWENDVEQPAKPTQPTQRIKLRIHEAQTLQECEHFWEELRRYQARDLFPNHETDRSDAEDLEYFYGEEYSEWINRVHDRDENRLYFLFFYEGDVEIGFAMPAIMDKQDGCCTIMEFCIYPEFRCQGRGTHAAIQLLEWCKARGTLFFELEYMNNERRKRFWETFGFVFVGHNKWGEPYMQLQF